jgi:predicted MFS family arabinose efflux permease
LRTFPLAVLLGYALGFIPALITGYWIAADRERRPSLLAALYRGAVVGSLYGAALAGILPRQKVLDFFLFFFFPALVATAACWWITQRKPDDALASK